MVTNMKKRAMSAVAVLCSLMIIIGIMPTGIMGINNEVNAAKGDEPKPKFGANGDSSQDIPVAGDSKPAHNPNKLYITSTFYDYYSDYEMSGKNRTTLSIANAEAFDSDAKFFEEYNSDGGKAGYGWTNRRYVPTLAFDVALSNYYEKNGVRDPLYFGHFQWKKDGDTFFVNLNNAIDSVDGYKRLYGSGTSGPQNKTDGTIYDEQYRKFFQNNNSEYRQGDINCQSGSTHTHKTDVAVQGLYANNLDANGNLMLYNNNGTDTIKAPFFDESFLRGENSSTYNIGQVYDNVDFPFNRVNGTYWQFDSSNPNHTVRMKRTTASEYYLDEVGSDGVVYGYTNGHILSVPNFFPFNSPIRNDITFDKTFTLTKLNSDLTYKPTDNSADEAHPTYTVNTCQDKTNGTYVEKLNYGFGMSMPIEFDLSSKLYDANGNNITFTFSGDDDMVVYLDGKLILDIGGSHGAVNGMIDFTEQKVYVSSIKTSTGETNGSDNTKTFAQLGFVEGKDGYTQKSSHTVKIFYMERGIWESNLKISFNLPVTSSITGLDVQKVVDYGSIPQKVIDNIEDNVDSMDFGMNFKVKSTPESMLNDCSHKGTVSFVQVNDTKGDFSCWNGVKESRDCLGIWLNSNANYTSTGDNKENYGPTFSFYNTVDLTQLNDDDSISFWFLKTGDDMGLKFTFVDSEGNGMAGGNNNGFALNSVGNGWLHNLSSMYSGWRDYNTKVGTNTWNKITVPVSTIRSYITNDDFDKTSVAGMKFTVSKTRTDFFIDDIELNIAENRKLDVPDGTYLLDGQTHNVSNGVFSLNNGDRARFNNQFLIDDDVYISEQDKFTFNSQKYNVSSLFGTKWELYQSGQSSAAKDGNSLGNVTDGTKDSDSKDKFVLDGTASQPQLVKFTNTIKTANIVISKTLVDENGNKVDFKDNEFTFELSLTDIGGMNLAGNSPVKLTLNTKNSGDGTVSYDEDNNVATLTVTVPINTKYTLTETNVGTGYKVVYTPGTVTDTDQTVASDSTVTVQNQKPVDVSVTKQWQKNGIDAAPADGTSITLQLYQGETEVEGKVVTLTYSNNAITTSNAALGEVTQTNAYTWGYTFKNLVARDNNGDKISYTIKETQINGFTDDKRYAVTTSGTTTITNNRLTTSLEVEKTWENFTPEDGVAIELTLSGGESNKTVTLKLQDGRVVAVGDATGTVALSDGKWKYTFTDLDRTTSSGAEITYTVSETAVRKNTDDLASQFNTTIGSVTGSKETGYKVSITNAYHSEPIVMPTTGGAGGRGVPYTVIGVTAILLSGIALLYIRRRNAEKANVSS